MLWLNWRVGFAFALPNVARVSGGLRYDPLLRRSADGVDRHSMELDFTSGYSETITSSG